MFQEGFAADRGTTAAVATSAGVRRSSNTHVRSASQCWGNGQISPPTTVRAARGAGRSRHFTSVFQGSWKSATVHTSSGVIGGIPRQSSMPIAITFLKNRVGFTATVEARFAVVVASIHIAAFAIMLWSEVDVVAKTTFALAWGFLNFVWLASLRLPGLSPALSLVMLIVLI